MSSLHIPGRGNRFLVAALEGFYGPPLPHDERLDLVRWLAQHGFDAYAYAPKDDPFHRERWREPYTAERRAELAELVEVGREHGIGVGLAVSPGLDWSDGDEGPLIDKLESFREMGASLLGVGWDDVPPGGADLGRRHGAAVAAAVASVGSDVTWVTCPTDYATTGATSYLQAFADALPPEAEVLWNGPSIVSKHVSADEARAVGEVFGRKPLFSDQYPVNDGGMMGMLHIGPYPRRDPELHTEVSGVVLNFMSKPLASRVGLGAALGWWRDPAGDREQHWKAILAEFAGLEPLARACRMWLDDPGPDRELLAWADAAFDGDTRLRDFLDAGCRDGLDPALAEELEPWLAQWETEAATMRLALGLLERDTPPDLEQVGEMMLAWFFCRPAVWQCFGARFSYYPVTTRHGDESVAHRDALLYGENLTDILCRKVNDTLG